MTRRLANNKGGCSLFTLELLLRLGNTFRAATLPSGFLRRALPTEAEAASTGAVSSLVAGVGKALASPVVEGVSGVLDRLVRSIWEVGDCFVTPAARKL